MRTTAIAAIMLTMIAGAPTADADERRSGSDERPVQLSMAVDLPEIDARGTPDDPVVCLALTLYWEGRGQGELAQKAVGYVVLNRARAAGYPPDICGVVTQGDRNGPCQFSWWCGDRSIRPTNAREWERAFRLAGEILAEPEDDPTDGALHFHRKDLTPGWARDKNGRPRVLGDHVFFRLARR